MAEPITFGRRRAAPTVLKSQILASDALALSPQAEAFTTKFAGNEDQSDLGFGDWLRKQQAGRVLAWSMTFVLLSPGILCFALNAPTSVSGGLELVGLVANFWLRRKRRRHLKEIAIWES